MSDHPGRLCGRDTADHHLQHQQQHSFQPSSFDYDTYLNTTPFAPDLSLLIDYPGPGNLDAHNLPNTDIATPPEKASSHSNFTFLDPYPASLPSLPFPAYPSAPLDRTEILGPIVPSPGHRGALVGNFGPNQVYFPTLNPYNSNLHPLPAPVPSRACQPYQIFKPPFSLLESPTGSVSMCTTTSMSSSSSVTTGSINPADLHPPLPWFDHNRNSTEVRPQDLPERSRLIHTHVDHDPVLFAHRTFQGHLPRFTQTDPDSDLDSEIAFDLASSLPSSPIGHWKYEDLVKRDAAPLGLAERWSSVVAAEVSTGMTMGLDLDLEDTGKDTTPRAKKTVDQEILELSTTAKSPYSPCSRNSSPEISLARFGGGGGGTLHVEVQGSSFKLPEETSDLTALSAYSTRRSTRVALKSKYESPSVDDESRPEVADEDEEWNENDKFDDDGGEVVGGNKEVTSIGENAHEGYLPVHLFDRKKTRRGLQLCHDEKIFQSVALRIRRHRS
jgi:hypothetical protein